MSDDTTTDAQSEQVSAPAEVAPVAETFLQQLEAAVKSAEHAGEHVAHGILNDLHMLSVQIKGKAAAAVENLEGEAGKLAQALHSFF